MVARIPYTSSELYHFVGQKNPDDHSSNCEILEEILKSTCVSHPPHDVDWGSVSYTVDPSKSLLDGELLVPEMTCYADIPFDSLGIHVEKYGRFGLSFDRDFLTRYGARPVMYFPKRLDDWQGAVGATLLRDIEVVYHGFRDYVIEGVLAGNADHSRTLGKKPENRDDAIRVLLTNFEKEFLAFIKPFNSELDENHPENFYMEREWRKLGNIMFNLHDVRRIVVAEGYKARLERQYPDYADLICEV